MNLDARLSELLTPNFVASRCQLVTNSAVLVQETDQAGAAQVTMRLPAVAECLVLTLERGQGDRDTQWFQFLRSQRCADGAFLVPGPAQTYEAHVVECKTTVGSGNWEKAKEQMAGTIARLRAVAAVLDIQIAQIYCYTAYRNDKLTAALGADLAELRPGVGASVRTAELLDWQRDRADLGCIGELPHRRIPLHQDANKMWGATEPVQSQMGVAANPA